MASKAEQRLASAMERVYHGGGVKRHERESDEDYFRRIRNKALRVMRHERRIKNRPARAARKANR